MVEPQELETVLRIIYESESGLEIWVTDESDDLDPLTNVTRASLAFLDMMGGTKLFERSTDGSVGQQLTIATNADGQKYVSCDAITTDEWVSLPVGSYVADLTIYDSVTGKWLWSEIFYVEIVEKGASSL